MAVAPRYRSGRSVWVFLAAGLFGTNSSDFGRWISLDFLGFSREKRDLSMGYAEKASKSFSWRICRGVRGAPLGFPGLGMRKRRTIHREILPQFLILCNRLSPEPFLSAGSTIDSPLDDRPASPISSMAYLRNDEGLRRNRMQANPPQATSRSASC
jgi:hypothetical protein